MIMMHLLLACFRKKVEQMTTYILNTIAFKPQLATKGQKEMIDLAKMLGFDAVEIRNGDYRIGTNCRSSKKCETGIVLQRK